MREIVLFFETKITAPRPWGIFHLSTLALVAAVAVIICAFGGRLRVRQGLCHWLTCGIGIFLIVIEALKHIFYGLHVGGNGEIYWDYPWQIFPFQLCSTPMYACFILMFTRRGSRIREALNVFIATYGAFGGAVVLLHPNAVFNDMLFADLHTMTWHGLLVVLGIIQWAGRTFRFRFSAWAGGSAVFAACVAVALALNLSFRGLGEEYGFNMFYISPYVPCTILFLEGLWREAPYPVFLAVYLFGFAAISAAIFCALGYLSRAVRSGIYAFTAPYEKRVFKINAKPFKQKNFKTGRKMRLHY